MHPASHPRTWRGLLLVLTLVTMAACGDPEGSLDDAVVTTPGDTLTWTLTANGETNAIPVGLIPAYQIEPFKDAAMGNTPPPSPLPSTNMSGTTS